MTRAKLKKFSADSTLHPHDVLPELVCLVTTADVIITLPLASRQTRGAMITVINNALSTGTGLQINPGSGDFIRGQTLAGVTMTAVVDKNLINTGATDVLGDSVTLVCDGETGWQVRNILGIWAKEA